MEPVQPQARLLGGRFELRGELGRGGMGVVYRALDRTIGREVALKVVLQGFTDPESRARFEREGQLTAALRHPNIVAVHSAGEVEGRPFIAYELVSGAVSLDRVLARLDLPARVAMVRDVARALGHAHAHGIVHRDVKPANVLVDDTGRPRVSDFGLATAAGLGRLTQTGEVMGTPSYMAPEQLNNTQAVGPATDVWALGGVLYRALTDEPPFAGTSFFQLAGQVLQGDPPRPPRSINPSVPPAIEAVCLACLRRDPAERPRDGEDLARLLDEALRAPDAPAHRRAALGALGAVAALVVAAAAWVATRPVGAVDRANVSVVPSARPARVSPPPREPARASTSEAPAADYEPPLPRSLPAAVLVELDSKDGFRVLAAAQPIIEHSTSPHEKAYALARAGKFIAERQAQLGSLLWNGAPGFAQNPQAARTWFERAIAAEAYDTAPRELAELYLTGPPDIRDLDKAIEYALLAIEKSHSRSAESILARAYSDRGYPRRDPAEAARWYGRVAERGDREARLRLEELCVGGEIPEDHPSLRYAPRTVAVAVPDDCPPDLRALLATDEVLGMTELAARLVDAHPQRAAPLLARALELGHDSSGMLLGTCLVESDPDLALELMIRAAVTRDPAVRLGPLSRLRTMTVRLGRLTDPLRARFWARQGAASVEHPVVLLLLGDLLLQEPVVDERGARRAYERAKALGDTEAVLKLEALDR